MESRLVVVGASLGGMAALKVLLQELAPAFTLPIAIVQHRHKDSANQIIEFLQRSTSLIVKEVEDKDQIASGYVYLAPADYHLLIEADHFALSTDDPVFYARPSIDVLFESAADVYRERTIGIILTGANQDGAAGAAAVKACGGVVMVQDPATAQSPVMPEAAIARTSVDEILSLPEIAARLNRLC
ncbi:MAG: chemotaxis protein CheB [Leptolyngbya sp. IPPAS B-1204]|nr:chemotaxis protein CheB [Elainella sp. C42_A2020_010]RNJ67850.1 MAG: chemotaxis protein CheB [Leptolyngbya sp. IPPAS B-1204]